MDSLFYKRSTYIKSSKTYRIKSSLKNLITAEKLDDSVVN